MKRGKSYPINNSYYVLFYNFCHAELVAVQSKSYQFAFWTASPNWKENWSDNYWFSAALMKMHPQLIRCSPSNKRHQLRVNLKSKIHPSWLRGSASSRDELCIGANNAPTCCNEPNKIDTGWYACTSIRGTKQKHLVQASTYAYSI